MMTPNVSDALTFPLAQPAGQQFHLFGELSQHLSIGLAKDSATTLTLTLQQRFSDYEFQKKFNRTGTGSLSSCLVYCAHVIQINLIPLSASFSSFS